MTICASVKVRDGLVLGTDSMAQIFGKSQDGIILPVKNYSNARKLFQIGQLPIGVMTYGIGNLGPRSIQGLARDFSREYKGDVNVEVVARQLYDFFNNAYQQSGNHGPNTPLGFYIAGFSIEKPFPEEWEFLLPRDKEIRQVRPIDSFGASWRGIEIPFIRLYKGFDPRTIEDLKKNGVSEEIINNSVKKFESPVVYDGMPVQDAINFTIFILNTTIGMSTFEIGFPSCGGPLQIATILPDVGFKWISEPNLSV